MDIPGPGLGTLLLSPLPLFSLIFRQLPPAAEAPGELPSVFPFFPNSCWTRRSNDFISRPLASRWVGPKLISALPTPPIDCF